MNLNVNLQFHDLQLVELHHQPYSGPKIRRATKGGEEPHPSQKPQVLQHVEDQKPSSSSFAEDRYKQVASWVKGDGAERGCSFLGFWFPTTKQIPIKSNQLTKCCR